MTRVLLVDDHPMIGAALDMLLSETDYKLLGRARTAAEANKQIASLKPDLLLLDVHLPDASGLDVLRRLSRARSRPTPTPYGPAAVPTDPSRGTAA